MLYSSSAVLAQSVGENPFEFNLFRPPAGVFRLSVASGSPTPIGVVLVALGIEHFRTIYRRNRTDPSLQPAMEFQVWIHTGMIMKPRTIPLGLRPRHPRGTGSPVSDRSGFRQRSGPVAWVKTEFPAGMVRVRPDQTGVRRFGNTPFRSTANLQEVSFRRTGGVVSHGPTNLPLRTSLGSRRFRRTLRYARLRSAPRAGSDDAGRPTT